MNQNNLSYKLITAGNKNIAATVNSIIAATLKLREDMDNDSVTFQPVHIFHTAESIKTMMENEEPWANALEKYQIPVTGIVHHVTKIEDFNIERFRDLVEQLKTIVNPLSNTSYYVDLTNGFSSLKAMLAVFAYVLDIENIYTLEFKFNSREDTKLFFNELSEKNIPYVYRRFPPIVEFDLLGKMNLTEILRYRKLFDSLTKKISARLSDDFDIKLLQTSLVAGLSALLIGDITRDSSTYRQSVFSSSAGIEETTNILLKEILEKDVEEKTLGPKLNELTDGLKKSGKHFINEEILNSMTHLMKTIRNNVIHSRSITEDIEIQARLSSQLAIAFLQYADKALQAFSTPGGTLLKVNLINQAEISKNCVMYFGFDGDSTGDYIADSFLNGIDGETEVKQKSKKIREAVRDISNFIRKHTQDNSAVIFAEGDDILFKAPYDSDLVSKIQKTYEEKTGLKSSIGFGQTLKEATIALRLSKSRNENSVLGIKIYDEKTRAH